jgi:prepilin-type N-terminal cleavage/methylation domain-containing protein
MSMTRNQRGFTLVELLIVMVILGVVSAAFVRSLTNASKVSQAQAEKTSMQSNLRAGGGFLPSEWREINIDASGSDLVSISPTSITYWAMRRTALACDGTSGTQVVLRNSNNFGLSNIQAGEQLLVFVEGDPATTGDDAWQSFTITGTATGTCADGTAATLVNVSGTVPTGDLLYDAPVRTAEQMTISIYSADGRWWLGASSNGATMQPVLGPLAASDSTFGFRTANGSATTTPSDVRVIEAVLHGETTNAISKSGYDTRQLNQDSLKIRVRLRNAP